MLVTLQKAQQITGYSNSHLRREIKEGNIPAIKQGKFWMIDDKDLEPHTKKRSKRQESVPTEKERSTQEVPFSVEMYRAETERMIRMEALTQLQSLVMSV